MEENQGFKPDPGNLAVRHYRGATGIVSHGGTVNPSCNRKSRNGNPSPTAQRARFLSQSRERTLSLTNLSTKRQRIAELARTETRGHLRYFLCQRVTDSVINTTASEALP